MAVSVICYFLIMLSILFVIQLQSLLSSNFDKMFPGESVTFTCKVDVSDGWLYLWYHDGTEVQPSSVGTYTIASIDHTHSGKYHCKAKRANGPFYTEESDTTALHVSDPPKPSLKLLSPWPDVFENETVEFRCEVHSPDWTISWNKGGNESRDELDEIQNAEGPFLNLTGIYATYEGGYTCKAHLKSRGVSSGFSNTVNITVYDHTPIPTLTRVPDFNPMYVGETVNLKCEVNLSSGWKYQWYKNGIEQQTTKETNSIKLSLSDRGKYQCRAARGEIISTEFISTWPARMLPAAVITVDQSATPLDVFPGESVKLSCAMAGGADWTFSWFKDKQPVQPHPTTSSDVGAATLSISSASASHGGQYSCLGKLKSRPSVTSTSSPELTLSVYGEDLFFLHMLSEILFSLSYQKLDSSTLLSVLTDFLMSYLHLSLTPFFKILLLFRLFLGNQPKPLMTQFIACVISTSLASTNFMLKIVESKKSVRRSIKRSVSLQKSRFRR
uniref:Ig-like domain-containing protein n=1 Tax=Gasterosteus aculeatus aculeatus TaxID=481459 RepID=A0AAQ4Q223_GASAC